MSDSAETIDDAEYVDTDGLVTVDGQPVVKASVKVRSNQVISVATADHYVSRAACVRDRTSPRSDIAASSRYTSEFGGQGTRM